MISKKKLPPRLPTAQPKRVAGPDGVVRVLLVDDHPLLTESMQLLLDQRPEIQVVGTCSNGREAVESAIELMPDVVLMDVDMPRLNGIEATAEIRKRAPRVRVIILSNYSNVSHIRDAIRAGASGFVLKRSDVEELMLAISTVRRKNTYFSSALSDLENFEDIVHEAKSAPSVPRELITPREREILQLFAEGHTAKSIAQLLYLSEKTVEAHRAHIATKLGAHNRVDLLKFAIQAGIITLE